jgi:hypothetical protein
MCPPFFTDALLLSSFVFPRPDTEYILPNHMVGRVLALWDFFARFGRVVNVTPFEFDHLCAALCADEQVQDQHPQKESSIHKRNPASIKGRHARTFIIDLEPNCCTAN